MDRQTVTSELRQWLQQQLSAGHSEATVLAAMVRAGWHIDIAQRALLAARDQPSGGTMAWARPVSDGRFATAALALPEPALDAGALHLDVGDALVQVQMAMQHPRVVVFGNLLSAQECDDLIALARPRMARSLTVDTKTGGEMQNQDRTSRGMFFQRGETPLVARLEERIAKLLHWPVENGEGLQVLQYTAGSEYKPHYDFFDPAEPATPQLLVRGGQRVATLVIYLAAPALGGATVFPQAQLAVAPQRGSAVFFSYAQASADTLTLHGGAPVTVGEKWVATKWLRANEFI